MYASTQETVNSGQNFTQIYVVVKEATMETSLTSCGDKLCCRLCTYERPLSQYIGSCSQFQGSGALHFKLQNLGFLLGLLCFQGDTLNAGLMSNKHSVFRECIFMIAVASPEQQQQKTPRFIRS